MNSTDEDKEKDAVQFVKKYKNKTAITPLGVEVPILFDESVKKEKGTGVMMCCTFGDNADVEKYKKYNLPLKIIICPIIYKSSHLQLSSLPLLSRNHQELF